MNLSRAFRSLSSTGLFNEPTEIVITDEPKIPVYTCFPSEKCSQKYETRDVTGQGIHTDRLRAQMKAAAELLERLCNFNPQPDKLSKPYVYSDNGEFVDPALFVCYSNDQVGDREAFCKNVRNKPYRWFKGYDYFQEKEVLIPAHIIFLDGVDDEFQITKESISTGSALGSVGAKRAFDGGLLETIERDACMHAYLTKRKMPKITGLSGEIAELVKYLKRYRLDVYPFVTTGDLNVPIAMTVTIDRTGVGPAVCLGSKASFNYRDAVLSSISESVQCRSYARLMKNVEFPDGLPKEGEIEEIKHRLFYWFPLERVNDLSFWLDTEEAVGFSELPRNTSRKEVLDRVRRRGFHLYVADMTLPEVREAGFEALKVIIPELLPLYLSEQAKALFSVHYGPIPDDPTLKPHPLT